MYYHHFDTLLYQTSKANHRNQEAARTGKLNRLDRWLTRIVHALFPEDLAVDIQNGDPDLRPSAVDPVSNEMAYLTYDYIGDLYCYYF
jgi:hypothetical protein